MGFIYMLTSPSGKSYIGQTTRSIQKRFEQHQTRNDCVAISNAIKKYGWENIQKDWYKCPDEDLDFDEGLLVEEMGTLSPGGYNLMEGGGSSGKPSEETRQKMRKAKQNMSEETRQKMSEAKKGEKHPMFGKTPSNETRKKNE
ncbi:GIY-YIG catalytic domain-containing endonuclease [Paramecium bursaria Chlorella virus Fr5L]|nr:GIY-YIG catalytic domain-containing endonuclease [Paramecium bursaria Chlorella virus Fr5L]